MSSGNGFIRTAFAVSLLLAAFSVAAEENDSSSVKNSWKKFGKDSAAAAKSLGKALGTTGKEIGKEVKDSVNDTFCGTWTYKGGKCTTVVVIDKDGTMSVTRKDEQGRQYWNGTYTGTVALILFKIEKSGRAGKSSATEVADNKTWKILYSVGDDKKTISLKCSAIPTDSDGHNFSDATVFNKS